MNRSGYALFETAIGRCGIAWTERGIASLSLPDAGAPGARARLSRRADDAEEAEPPASVAEVIARVRALLAGEHIDLADVVLDDAAVPAFDAAVYAQARAIPPGRTLTYGEIARGISDPAAARRVGQALGRNPWPIVVPCHRVLAAGGGAGGFSAPGGAATKLRLLSIEHASTSPDPLLFADLPLASAGVAPPTDTVGARSGGAR